MRRPAFLLLMFLSGCSGPAPRTVENDPYQTITVNTPGVENVSCIVQSASGAQQIEAPGPITVPRSPQPLIVNCFKGEHLRGMQRVAASVAPAEAQVTRGCRTCRYPGIITVAMRLNDSLMDVPRLRQMP